tara:strand:- start:3514 stop:4416 length:903 start_codon:yes stop_codon:yes gene_type:complete
MILKKIKHRLFYLLINIRFFIRTLVGKKSGSAKLLSKNGIIKLKCDGISDHILNLIDDFKNNKNDSNFKILNKNNDGIKSLRVNLESEFLWKYIFTDEIYKTIRGYYGGNFYLRNNPSIIFNYDNEKHGAQLYHLDWGLRQVSIMVSLSDVLNESTHMKYILKSNNSYWFKHPDRNSISFQNKVDKLKRKDELIFSTIGSKDNLYIFDAGNGFHRQVGGGKRIMMHFNFVENFTFTDWDKAWSPGLKSNDDIWFSKPSKKIDNFISKSPFPKEVFSIVHRKYEPSLFTPSILSKNYNLGY